MTTIARTTKKKKRNVLHVVFPSPTPPSMAQWGHSFWINWSTQVKWLMTRIACRVLGGGKKVIKTLADFATQKEKIKLAAALRGHLSAFKAITE